MDAVVAEVTAVVAGVVLVELSELEEAGVVGSGVAMVDDTLARSVVGLGEAVVNSVRAVGALVDVVVVFVVLLVCVVESVLVVVKFVEVGGVEEPAAASPLGVDLPKTTAPDSAPSSTSPGVVVFLSFRTLRARLSARLSILGVGRPGPRPEPRPGPGVELGAGRPRTDSGSAPGTGACDSPTAVGASVG